VGWNRKTKKTARGWPLSTVSAPYAWSHRNFMSDRLTVSAAKASLVRRVKVKGGSRAVRSVASTIATNLSRYAHMDSNPPSPAGSTFVHNESVDGFDDLAMRTGAGDAKTDEQMFAWMALIGMGVYPHYAGKEGAFRLATTKMMEKPIQAVYNQYRIFWGAQFRTLLEVVSLFATWYGGETFKTLKADVSTDSMTTVDLLNAAPGISTLFRDILIPLADSGRIPPEAVAEAAEHVYVMAMDALGGTVSEEIPEAFKEVMAFLQKQREVNQDPDALTVTAKPPADETNTEAPKPKPGPEAPDQSEVPDQK